MTGPSCNRLSICLLRFRIASPRVPIDLGQETVWEAILNLSAQIDLFFTLKGSHYLFNIVLLEQFQEM